MKNQDRVRQKRKADKDSSQAQTELSATRERAATVTLQFLNEKDGEEFARVELARKTYRSMRAAARHGGVSVSEFIQRGVLEKLHRLEAALAETGRAGEGHCSQVAKVNGEAGGGHRPARAPGGDPASQLAESLALSTEQAEALSLICEWEQMTPEDFCHRWVLAGMKASFDDMSSHHAGHRTTASEQEWAGHFFSRLAPLMAEYVQEEALNLAKKGLAS